MDTITKLEMMSDELNIKKSDVQEHLMVTENSIAKLKSSEVEDLTEVKVLEDRADRLRAEIDGIDEELAQVEEDLHLLYSQEAEAVYDSMEMYEEPHKAKRYVFTMGLLGLILPFTFYLSIPGFILSIMALTMSGKFKDIQGGEKAGKILGLIGLISSIVLVIISIILFSGFIAMMRELVYALPYLIY